MVFKKSFAFLIAAGTTPFFAVVSIISENDCRQHLWSNYASFDTSYGEQTSYKFLKSYLFVVTVTIISKGI